MTTDLENIKKEMELCYKIKPNYRNSIDRHYEWKKRYRKAVKEYFIFALNNWKEFSQQKRSGKMYGFLY